MSPERAVFIALVDYTISVLDACSIALFENILTETAPRRAIYLYSCVVQIIHLRLYELEDRQKPDTFALAPVFLCPSDECQSVHAAWENPKRRSSE